MYSPAASPTIRSARTFMMVLLRVHSGEGLVSCLSPTIRTAMPIKWWFEPCMYVPHTYCPPPGQTWHASLLLLCSAAFEVDQNLMNHEQGLRTYIYLRTLLWFGCTHALAAAPWSGGEAVMAWSGSSHISAEGCLLQLTALGCCAPISSDPRARNKTYADRLPMACLYLRCFLLHSHSYSISCINDHQGRQLLDNAYIYLYIYACVCICYVYVVRRSCTP
jgi:hypothetical protein